MRAMQSSTMKGGMGSNMKDTDMFRNVTIMALDQAGANNDKRGGTFYNNNNTMNQQSNTSLVNIQERQEPSMNASFKPSHIEGITDFLRGEYHRKFGCFINGARDEESKLI